MAEVTATMVKELRERTQAGMSDCKNALVEAGGNMDAAVEIILKKGIVKAASRAGRVATEGEIRTWVSPDKRRAVIVEVNCQTDFVARGDDFKNFVTKVTELASKSAKGTDLLTQKFAGESRTVEEVRAELVSKTGENCVVRRWDLVETKSATGIVVAYVHPGNKLAVLLSAEAPSDTALKATEFSAFIENCAMQVAAMSPMVVRKEEVLPATVEKQKEIFVGQLKEEGKPEQAWPKIVEGKVAKWFTEVTLLGQDNVWDPPAGTIDKVRGEVGKTLGGEVKIHSFSRYSLGEGMEKKSDDLAEEVAKMM